jgi:hypothetical protein
MVLNFATARHDVALKIDIIESGLKWRDKGLSSLDDCIQYVAEETPTTH